MKADLLIVVRRVAWKFSEAELTELYRLWRPSCSFRQVLLKAGMVKLQAIFQDGSVGMEFMTEDSSQRRRDVQSPLPDRVILISL